MHSLTFTSWIHPETHFSTTFKTISIYLHVKQVELAPGSSRTTQNSLISQSCQKYRPTKQILKLFSMEIIFQTAPNFIGTSGHWSRIPVPNTKLLAHLLLVFRHVDVYMY